MSSTAHLMHVRNSVTGRIRLIQPSYLATLRTEHWAWEPISDEEAQADVHYIRNYAGGVHSIASADLAEALAADGTVEITEEEAREAAPELFPAQSTKESR